MSNFENHPERAEFGELTLERGLEGVYRVSATDRDEAVGTVQPFEARDWMWTHRETGRSGYAPKLDKAAAGIWEIEKTRS